MPGPGGDDMRWLIRILILFAVLVALAVGAIFLIPTDRIAQIAATRFEAATGRKLTIAGGIHATLWPELGVRTGQVEIANAAWAAKDGPMVRAKGLQIGIAPDVLWGGDLKIRRVALDQPQLLLERAK
ncbi:AsmA family protein, partial [Thioclava sp. BHET1]